GGGVWGGGLPPPNQKEYHPHAQNPRTWSDRDQGPGAAGRDRARPRDRLRRDHLRHPGSGDPRRRPRPEPRPRPLRRRRDRPRVVERSRLLPRRRPVPDRPGGPAPVRRARARPRLRSSHLRRGARLQRPGVRRQLGLARRAPAPDRPDSGRLRGPARVRVHRPENVPRPVRPRVRLFDGGHDGVGHRARHRQRRDPARHLAPLHRRRIHHRPGTSLRRRHRRGPRQRRPGRHPARRAAGSGPRPAPGNRRPGPGGLHGRPAPTRLRRPGDAGTVQPTDHRPRRHRPDRRRARDGARDGRALERGRVGV
ncbi:MAG: hypothetical protein AVDCRST_MAG73-2182, partial [uncultured Thermomicrobiales bacterium]